jgi:CcmD family protein
MTYRYFLFVAYSGVFAAFFVYMWMIVSRQKKLERKLDELKDQLGRGTPNLR